MKIEELSRPGWVFDRRSQMHPKQTILRVLENRGAFRIVLLACGHQVISSGKGKRLWARCNQCTIDRIRKINKEKP